MLGIARGFVGHRFLPKFVGLLVVLAVLPAAAQASQVGAVSVEACVGEEGCSAASQVRVDQQFGLSLNFHVTNGLGPGSRIYVEGPEGFVFSNSLHDIQINYNLGGYSDGGHATFNNGRGFEVTIASFGPSVPAGSEVGLTLGFFERAMTMPAHPGSIHFKVWTSSDGEARESSNAITTTIGEPATLHVLTPSISETVGQTFSGQPEVEVLDSRGNPISGQTVTFEVPGAEPSGSFTGAATSSTGTTDSNGIATPSLALTAGTDAGEWEIAVSGPNSTSTTILAANLPGAAEHVELSLQPETLPADEKSTSEATVSVTDQYGNHVTGDHVEIETSGGPTATTPSLQGNGTFTSELTASRVPGEYTITATDATAGISETATLTQTKLPAAHITLTIKPAGVLADPTETAVAVATVTDELGQPVKGEAVIFESPYTEGVKPPVDNGDGTYTWQVPVTAIPGEYKITAVDTSVEPHISAGATLTQNAKPKIETPGPGITPPASPPTVKIQAGPKGTLHQAKVQFKFSAPGAASFQCRIDKGPWKTCSSPAAFSVGVGRHVFQVKALNASGAPGPVAEQSFKRAAEKRHHHSKGRSGH